MYKWCKLVLWLSDVCRDYDGWGIFNLFIFNYNFFYKKNLN